MRFLTIPVIVALVLGLIGGALVITTIPKAFVPSFGFTSDSCDNTYSLINPWLRCEADENALKKKEFSDFKAGVQARIDAYRAQGKITQASVYLRDLEFGPWMGINEDEEYSAASLLKVPVLMAVLKQAETDPETLQQRVEVTQDFVVRFTQEFKPENRVKAGGVYSVEELLNYMIIDSDNGAKAALDAYLNARSPSDPPLLQMLEELGFIGNYRSISDSLSVKQVASMFRILYNVSYLDKEMSQKALSLLAQSTFSSGIVAGVDRGIPVAHKFGEREDDNGIQQLHDCGIVYYPKNDYLLCVMTRGRDIHELASVIADISRSVYKEIEARNTP